VAFISDVCLTCGTRLERSDRIVAGRVVIRCPRCKSTWLEGDSKRFEADDPDGAVHALRTRAAFLARDAQDDRRWREILESENDARWTQL